MIMILFGALSAGTKTYLLCRSDRQAFTSAFCNTLPVGCLKLKALSQLLGKLVDKALASLSGIIGSMLLWILNRAKEVVGWLSQNLWALITGVGVLIYTYFMTKTRRR